MKPVYLFFASLLIFMLHLPVAFSSGKKVNTENVSLTTTTSATSDNSALASMMMVYDSLHLDLKGLSQQAFTKAVKGIMVLRNAGKIANDNIISIADFTKPSSQKRLFVIDLKNVKVLFNTYVAHGQHTGEAFAKYFSNKPESFQSSRGFYRTSSTYIGKNGYSMKLEGLEAGINDLAEARAIVMHGAPYVSESFIHARGFLGRSWGCPAVPEELNKPIIEKIKNGTCLFIYSEDANYQHRSRIINS
jgi:hypothetical protein